MKTSLPTGQSTNDLANSSSEMRVRLPLCVDLDGTLIKTDLLFESCLLFLKQNPWALFLIPLWLLRGRSNLKRQLASRIRLSAEMLPYRQDVLEFIRAERASGRQILLVTAADQTLAEKIGEYLGCLDGIYGSDGSVNLKGTAKAGFLVGLLGKGNFDYLGDSSSDVPVWQAARAAYVVGGERLAKRAASATPVVRTFDAPSPSFIAWLRSIRLLHWSKNLLVLLPVILAHRLEWAGLSTSLIGFLLFGACASGMYILNDLLDLHSDRLHPSKSKRPFAAGELPLWVGAIEATLLVGSSLILSFFINVPFALALCGYAALTLTYSWKLKKIALLDVFVLSSFYTVRIWAGGLISGTPVSDWLMAFSLFFFLSLAMAKRHSELRHVSELVETGNSGRGYMVDDRELLAMFGIASSFAAVVILCLYARSPEVNLLYGNPAALMWLCPLVLYWLSRVWLLAVRGQLDLDPVLFAVRDRTSWVLGVLAIAVLATGGFRTR
jgi:4-hydroxybenzoate polyprenyltransferase